MAKNLTKLMKDINMYAEKAQQNSNKINIKKVRPWQIKLLKTKANENFLKNPQKQDFRNFRMKSFIPKEQQLKKNFFKWKSIILGLWKKPKKYNNLRGVHSRETPEILCITGSVVDCLEAVPVDSLSSDIELVVRLGRSAAEESP